MQGIGAVIGIEADFEVVGLAAMFFEEFADLEAEVAFHFEDESAGPPFPIGRAMGKDLFGKRVHAAAGLAGADGAEYGDAGEQATVGDREPVRVLHGSQPGCVMDFANYYE